MTKYESITVTGKVTTLVDENRRRKYLRIFNTSSTIVYVGHDNKVSSDEGSPIPQNAELRIDCTNLYRGALYAVTSSGTADVRILEF